MVAHLVSLRFAILRNSLRTSAWQLVGMIVGALYGLGLLVFVVIGLFFLGSAETELAFIIITLVGALVIVGWWLLPLFTTGIDQTVDPSRLATFPIRVNTLVAGLTASGVLGIPGLVTLIASLATIATWARHPAAAIAAGISAVIATLLCVVGSRTVAALASGIGAGRRAREAKTILVFIPLILLGPIFAGVASLVSSSTQTLPGIAQTVSWTPFGAIWAVPADIAEGQYGQAAAKFVIALVTLAALLVLWRFGLAKALETPVKESGGKASKSELGLFARFPGTQTGAVAARSLTYWLRDPRYAQSLITVPLIPILLAFYSSTNGSNGIMNATGPVVAFLLAISIYADIAYDNTAFALHLSTGVPGKADRAGRVIALSVFAAPLTIIATVGTVWWTGSWEVLPGLLGLSVSALLAGMAVSSVVSASVVFAVPAPGDSPFKSKAGGGFTLMVWMLAVTGAVALISLPTGVLAIISFVSGDPVWGWAALGAGVVIGGIVLAIGIRWGGSLLEKRGPELLTKIASFK